MNAHYLKKIATALVLLVALTGFGCAGQMGDSMDNMMDKPTNEMMDRDTGKNMDKMNGGMEQETMKGAGDAMMNTDDGKMMK